ncbi:hypothetical protein ACFX2A_024752 [Malus domestica]
MRTPHPNHHPSKSATAPAEDDSDSTRPTMPGLGVSVADGLLKKGVCVKPWLLLDSSGQAQSDNRLETRESVEKVLGFIQSDNRLEGLRRFESPVSPEDETH